MRTRRRVYLHALEGGSSYRPRSGVHRQRWPPCTFWRGVVVVVVMVVVCVCVRVCGGGWLRPGMRRQRWPPCSPWGGGRGGVLTSARCAQAAVASMLSFSFRRNSSTNGPTSRGAVTGAWMMAGLCCGLWCQVFRLTLGFSTSLISGHIANAKKVLERRFLTKRRRATLQVQLTPDYDLLVMNSVTILMASRTTTFVVLKVREVHAHQHHAHFTSTSPKPRTLYTTHTNTNAKHTTPHTPTRSLSTKFKQNNRAPYLDFEDSCSSRTRPCNRLMSALISFDLSIFSPNLQCQGQG
jgi:hypothetical protein